MTLQIIRTHPWRSAQAAILFGLMLYFGYNSVMRVFYGVGAITDTFLFAGLIWHNNPLDLQMPGNYEAGAFSRIHWSPFLSLWTMASYLWPWDRISWFGLFSTLMYVAAPLLAFYMLLKVQNRISPRRYALILMITAFIPLSPIFTNSLAMPHYEFWLPPLLGLFALMLAFDRPRLAVIPFTLALSMREDAPLHMLVMLGACLFIFFLDAEGGILKRLGQLWHERKAAIIYTFVTTLLAAGAMYAEKQLDDGLHFKDVYAGHPPWAHVKWVVMEPRLYFFLYERSAIWLPLLLSLPPLLFPKWRLLAAGALAQIPWLLISLVSYNINPHEFDWYYGFPFMLVLLWPPLALLWLKKPMKQWMMIWYLLIICGSVINNQYRGIHFSLNTDHTMLVDTISNPAAVAKVAEAITVDKEALGIIRADQASLGLVGDVLSFRTNVFYAARLSIDTPKGDKSYFYIPHSYDHPVASYEISRFADLSCYIFTGLKMQLATNVPIEKLPHLAPLMQPVKTECPAGDMSVPAPQP